MGRDRSLWGSREASPPPALRLPHPSTDTHPSFARPCIDLLHFWLHRIFIGGFILLRCCHSGFGNCNRRRFCLMRSSLGWRSHLPDPLGPLTVANLVDPVLSSVFERSKPLLSNESLPSSNHDHIVHPSSLAFDRFGVHSRLSDPPLAASQLSLLVLPLNLAFDRSLHSPLRPDQTQLVSIDQPNPLSPCLKRDAASCELVLGVVGVGGTVELECCRGG